jgi:hypothetical protein
MSRVRCFILIVYVDLRNRELGHSNHPRGATGINPLPESSRPVQSVEESYYDVSTDSFLYTLKACPTSEEFL